MMWSQPGSNHNYFGPASQEANGPLARPINGPKLSPFLSPHLQSLSLLSPWFASSSNPNQQLPNPLGSGSNNNNLKQQVNNSGRMFPSLPRQSSFINSDYGIPMLPTETPSTSSSFSSSSFQNCIMVPMNVPGRVDNGAAPVCLAPPGRSSYPSISALPGIGANPPIINPLQLNAMFGADGTTYSPQTPALLVASLAPRLLQKSPAHKKRMLREPDSLQSVELTERQAGPAPTKGTSQQVKRVKKAPNPDLSLNGERRLIINFENFGTRGEYPQTFGKARRLVPDGLSGTHTLYSERWHFKVEHSPVVEDNEGRHIVCLVWEITNLTTLCVTLRKETLEEALERMNNGRTITNDVFRAAMEARAKSLEAAAMNEKNEAQATNILCRVKALRPRCFNQGILVFGLQHRIVQEKLDNPINFGFNERSEQEQEEHDDEDSEQL